MPSRRATSSMDPASSKIRRPAQATTDPGRTSGSRPIPARINVVTLPGRDTVQLTIYNSADLTLVKETRTLTFRKGMNKLEFSWANTLIDPTSVEFRALTQADKVEVLDVSFPARVTNTLEWRINSDFASEVEVEIRYFTSGISWSADYVAEAVEVSKAIGVPVQVTWTREDDMRCGYYQPATAERFTAGLDRNGAPVALVHATTELPEAFMATAG